MSEVLSLRDPQESYSTGRYSSKEMSDHVQSNSRIQDCNRCAEGNETGRLRELVAFAGGLIMVSWALGAVSLGFWEKRENGLVGRYGIQVITTAIQGQ